MFVGNTGDESWMNLQPDNDTGYADIDLSSLNVKPEYHTGRPTYTCPRCGKQFLYSSQLRQHMRFHLKHRPFRCPVCSKTFVQTSNLTEHFRVHSDERPFACYVCERRFRQSSNLNYHIRTAHNQANTTSGDKQSEPTTADSSALEKEAKHSEAKSFSCEHCGRSFAHACQLTNHARVHTRDRPYQCQYCQKMFAYSSNLSEHERIHTGVRPYVCGTCSRRFAQSSQLKVHVKAHHPNADSATTLLVVCPVCDAHVTGLRSLRDHLKLHSSDSQQSAESLHLKRPAAKVRPNRQKPLPSFKHLTRSRKSIKHQSVKRRGVKSVMQCDVPGDHTVKRTYVCCYCEKAFTKRSQLMMHLLLHEDTPLEPSRSLSSTARQMNVDIKTKDGNESESSTTDVEESVKVQSARSQRKTNQDGHRLSAHRERWKTHVKKHNAQKSRSSNKKDLSSKKSPRSSKRTVPHNQKDAVEQLDRKRTRSAVKVENGNSGSYGENSHPEISLDGDEDDGGDVDDNTEELDVKPTRLGQDSKESLASEGAGKLLADAAATRSGKRSGRKKSKPAENKSRTYPCGECDRVMASAAALHYHRRTHSGYKPFACSLCPRRFIIRGQLVEHERVHSGEKPFACDACPKRFAQSSQLRQHASIHSEVGTHVCPTCGEAFTRPWRLLSHRRAAHADDSVSQKRYRCDDCGREYSLRQSWVYHRLTHTTDRPFQCDVCSRQFRVAGQLRQHENHCRGRKADKLTTVDPYHQPPQNWMWFSELNTDLLTSAVNQAGVSDVPSDTSMLYHSGVGEHRPELGGTEFQQL